MTKMQAYFYHLLIAIDQLFNAIFAGAADETISSRCYRGAMLETKPKLKYRIAYHLINGLFFDRTHCKTAYESECNRKQFPPDFQKLS